MTPRKSYAGFTGLELLSLVTNDCSPVVINFESVVLIPRTMPFSNRAEIAEVFAKSKVTGETQISPDGTQAQVPFVFGPDGDREETMVLINRDGKWYLLGF